MMITLSTIPYLEESLLKKLEVISVGLILVFFGAGLPLKLLLFDQLLKRLLSRSELRMLLDQTLVV